MKIESIEILLVLVIVSVQVYVFARTFKQIRLFKNIIPDINSLRISKVLVPSADLERLPPKEILAKIDVYKNNFGDGESPDLFFEKPENSNPIEKAEVNIIETDAESNSIFEKMLFSTNNYLIRNRGAASDFNLIKDIVERNTDAVEEDINSSIGIPLYLGLMGTMMGIVIALFNMPDLNVELGSSNTGQTLDEGISMLIGGVKIAMIASFLGLMLTIINSGWIFKGSRVSALRTTCLIFQDLFYSSEGRGH